jgi:hypothetical protein
MRQRRSGPMAGVGYASPAYTPMPSPASSPAAGVQGQPGQAGQIQVGDMIYFGQDFYIYTANFGNLTALANGVQNVQIQSDSDFEWIEATCYGNLHGATEPFTDSVLLPIDISLVDSGSSRQLFSAPIPITTFAGTGKQPFILPVSRLFKAYSNLQVSATNFDASNQYDNIQLNFIGRKLFLNSSR